MEKAMVRDPVRRQCQYTLPEGPSVERNRMVRRCASEQFLDFVAPLFRARYTGTPRDSSERQS